MKATLLMKAAACVCPVTVLAASTAIVPPVRHAVHKATRPAQPDRPVHKLLTYAAPAPKPCAGALKDVSFPAGGDDAAGGESGPLLDDGAGSSLGSSPGERFASIGGGSSGGGATSSGGSTSGGGGTSSGGGTSGGGGTSSGGTSSGGPGTPGALPEPATWLMMIMGFGGIGWVLRSPPRRRGRSSATSRASKWPRFTAGLGMTGYAAGAARGEVAKAAAAANGARWAMAAKTAAVCLCPPALVATTAATVPPVRNAVYHATSPANPPLRTLESAPPCIPDLDNVAPSFTGGDRVTTHDLLQTVGQPTPVIAAPADQISKPLITAREDGPSSSSAI